MTKAKRAAAAALVGAFVLGRAAGADAQALDLGTTSPLTITSAQWQRDATLQFEPEKATAVRLAATGKESLFPSQDVDAVKSGIEALFGVTGLSFVGECNPDCTGEITGAGSGHGGQFMFGKRINYVAIHAGDRELVFYYKQAPVTAGFFVIGMPQDYKNVRLFSGGRPLSP